MLGALRFVMTATGFALIFVGIVGLLLFREMEHHVKNRLETAFGEAFTAPVRIGSISVSPFTRTVNMRDVVVSNPEGFKQGTAFASERIRLDVDPATVFSSAPLIRQAVVEKADIYYRYEVGQGFNIDKLTERAEAYSDGGKARRFVLEEIRCTGAKVHFSTNLIPKARVGVNLIDVTIDDVNETKPVTPRKAAAIFFKSLAMEVVTLRGLVQMPALEPSE